MIFFVWFYILVLSAPIYSLKGLTVLYLARSQFKLLDFQ